MSAASALPLLKVDRLTRRSLMHRGTKNGHVPVEQVILPDGYRLPSNAFLPETEVEEGWRTYHLLRASLSHELSREQGGLRLGDLDTRAEKRREVLDAVERVFPSPEYTVRFSVQRCYHEKATQPIMFFTILYIYAKTGTVEDTDFLNWWE